MNVPRVNIIILSILKLERDIKTQTLVPKYLVKCEQQSHKHSPQVHPPPPKHKDAQS